MGDLLKYCQVLVECERVNMSVNESRCASVCERALVSVCWLVAGEGGGEKGGGALLSPLFSFHAVLPETKTRRN